MSIWELAKEVVKGVIGAEEKNPTIGYKIGDFAKRNQSGDSSPSSGLSPMRNAMQKSMDTGFYGHMKVSKKTHDPSRWEKL